MEKSEELRRYKWSSSATNLLVSIWCHDLVQNQLKMSSRNQPIWESIARYMSRKGFSVSGLQCKTRIKNMLCSYHEAVRKSDPSGIEPYFDIFKKVLSSKNSKKKDAKTSKFKSPQCAEGSEVENKTYEDIENEAFMQNSTDSAYQVEILNINNHDSQTSKSYSNLEILKRLENIIIKAIDSQTKILTNTIKIQSEIIENFLSAERKKLETIIASERESRKQLEMRLDRLLLRLETCCASRATCSETIDSGQKE